MVSIKPKLTGDTPYPLSRRSVLAWGAGAGTAAALSRARWAGASPRSGLSPDAPQDAHFLLFIAIGPGLDNTYFFDHRHPSLTDANRKSNYLYKNDLSGSKVLSSEYTAAKVDARTIRCAETNATALRSPLVDSLYRDFGDRFSIVNGVYMIRDGFDGHDNNMSYLFSSSFTGGGDFFAPIAANGLTRAMGRSAPLDTTVFGFIPFNPLPVNLGSSVLFGSGNGGSLGDTLRSGPKFDTKSPLMAHIIARAEANRVGGGLFARGSGNLANALRNTQALGEALSSDGIDVGSGGGTEGGSSGVSGAVPDAILSPVRQALGQFRSGVTRVATVVALPDVDFHGATESQQNVLTGFTTIADQLHGIFDLLANTVYREEVAGGKRQTFLDVTTVMITSEFGRTNKSDLGDRQAIDNAPVGNTGTDHNRYSNSVILAGKGIRGGLVLGESDLRAVDGQGAYRDVSGAHRAKEEKLNHIMGKPFDFAAQRTRADLPSTFDERDYICMPSVVNTVLSVFGVDSQSYQKLGSVPAPLLTKVRA